jgi:hypothetical protein
MKPSMTEPSFDHSICAQENGAGQIHAECLRRLRVDNELDAIGEFDRQLARRGARQDPVSEASHLAPLQILVRPIGGERSELRPEGGGIHRREPAGRGHLQASARDVEVETGLHDEDAVSPAGHQLGEARLDCAPIRYGAVDQRDVEASRRGPGRGEGVALLGLTRIVGHEDAAERRDDFLEELEALAGQLGSQTSHAGDVASRLGDTSDEAKLHRVPRLREDDRDGRSRFLAGLGIRAGNAVQKVRPLARQLRGQGGQARGIALGGPDVEREALALHIAQLLQAIPESLRVAVPGRPCRGKNANLHRLASLGKDRRRQTQHRE